MRMEAGRITGASCIEYRNIYANTYDEVIRGNIERMEIEKINEFIIRTVNSFADWAFM